MTIRSSSFLVNCSLRYNALVSLDDIIETTALFNKEQITASLMVSGSHIYHKNNFGTNFEATKTMS